MPGIYTLIVQNTYIIMEEAPGTKLEDVWDHLPLEDRIVIMKDLLLIENKLLSVSFSWYELLLNPLKWI